MFGVESLPYLQTLRDAYYRPNEPGRRRVGGWLLPHFWNPHFDADTVPPASANPNKYPTEFRFIVESPLVTPTGAATDPTKKTAGSLRVNLNGKKDGQSSSSNSPFGTARQFDSNDYVLFQRTATQTFRDPIYLQPDFASGPGDASQVLANGDRPLSGFVGLVIGGTTTPTGAQVQDLPDKRISGGTGDVYVDEFGFSLTSLSAAPTFLVQVKDSNGKWRTYQEWRGLFAGGAGTRGMDGTAFWRSFPDPVDPTKQQWFYQSVGTKLPADETAWADDCARSAISSRSFYVTDPRSTRFGVHQANLERIFVGYLDIAPSRPTNKTFYDPSNLPTGNRDSAFIWKGLTPNPDRTAWGRASYGRRAGADLPGWTTLNPGAPSPGEDTNPGHIPFNLTTLGSARVSYYRDVDGVLRAADYSLTPVATGSLKFANPLLPYKIPLMDPVTGALTDSPTTAAKAAHPIVLNRPFRSVSEMGYAFRDVPWKSLDFFSSNSGDSGLLDLFATGDSVPLITAGKISLNSANPAVLEALIRGTRLHDSGTGAGSEITPAMAAGIARDIVDVSAGTSSTPGIPFLNRSELVTRIDLQTKLATRFDPNVHVFKGQREVVQRALGEAVQTRTWNLLVDLIVQSGKIPSNATSVAQFAVEGEKHYWVHLALDRFTGKIVSIDIEPIIN